MYRFFAPLLLVVLLASCKKADALREEAFHTAVVGLYTQDVNFNAPEYSAVDNDFISMPNDSDTSSVWICGIGKLPERSMVVLKKDGDKFKVITATLGYKK